ncbi:MAG: hypothetical protein P1P90_01780 [Patescibacteria group bacterium]|nr:hypothetical protein [Patescibacteria group bacterium]
MEARCREDKNRPSEPPYARKTLEEGKIATGLFKGQALIFIPRYVCCKLGKERIHALARRVYGQLRLNVFRADNFEYRNSYCLELPPSTTLAYMFITMLHEELKKSP